MSIEFEGDHVHRGTGVRFAFRVSYDVVSATAVSARGVIRQGGKSWPFTERTLVSRHGDAAVAAPQIVLEAVRGCIDTDEYLAP